MPRFIMFLLPLLLPMLINAGTVYFSLYASTDGSCSGGREGQSDMGLQPLYNFTTDSPGSCVSYNSYKPALPLQFGLSDKFMKFTCSFSKSPSPEISIHQHCTDNMCTDCSVYHQEIPSGEEIVGSCITFSENDPDLKIQSQTTVTDLCGKDYASEYSSYYNYIMGDNMGSDSYDMGSDSYDMEDDGSGSGNSISPTPTTAPSPAPTSGSMGDNMGSGSGNSISPTPTPAPSPAPTLGPNNVDDEDDEDDEDNTDDTDVDVDGYGESHHQETDTCSYESILAACKARRGAYAWTCSKEWKTDRLCKDRDEEITALHIEVDELRVQVAGLKAGLKDSTP